MTRTFNQVPVPRWPAAAAGERTRMRVNHVSAISIIKNRADLAGPEGNLNHIVQFTMISVSILH